MTPEAAKELFFTLLEASTPSQFRSVLMNIGDFDGATLDVPFGDAGLVWKAFGNNASNVSTIGLGTKPGRSLTERVTNAIDALLELKARQGASAQTSPRRAAQAWFGRPLSTATSGLFSWKNEPDGFDAQIHVVVHPSGDPTSPTIDVLDHGIGLAAAHFPSTILSLQAGNKIRKRHQIGAFGQGGSATLGFCSYALIASRSYDAADRIAFTVVRVLRLDASYKEDCYAYLADAISGTPLILDVDIGEAGIDLFPGHADAKIPHLKHGTLVRHVGYRLSNLEKSFQASPGNLYHYLQYSVFDPIIPFRIVDLRGSPENTKNERIGGSRNRLLARTVESQLKKDEEANIQIRHYRPLEYIVPVGSSEASIGVEYWVVLAFKKKGDDYELRGNSNELFVQTGHPILGALNGQNQGDLTASLLKQIGYGLLSRHMVVHIDATDADSTVRRELFSTSREGFKEGPTLDNIMALVKQILQEDERLVELERELTERITKKEADSAKAEVKQAVSKLLREAGFAVKDPGKVSGEGHGEKEDVTKKKPRKPIVRQPLPTLPYPAVTRFEIVYPLDVFQLPVNDVQSIVVETDADAQFDKYVQIRSDPPILEVATRAPLIGGRVRWRLRVRPNAKAGEHGEVIATLTKPDGSQLSSKVLFELLPPHEKRAKTDPGEIPPFEIIPISPDDGETWATLWPDDNSDLQKQQEHAYKALKTGSSVNVYFSTIFGPYKSAVETLKATKPLRVSSFETHYQVWIAYHAILQDQSTRLQSSGYDGTSEESIDRLQEIERQTVGRVQVRQALRTSELLEQAAKAVEGA